LRRTIAGEPEQFAPNDGRLTDATLRARDRRGHAVQDTGLSRGSDGRLDAERACEYDSTVRHGNGARCERKRLLLSAGVERSHDVVLR
jgi:hypothetical protein